MSGRVTGTRPGPARGWTLWLAAACLAAAPALAAQDVFVSAKGHDASGDGSRGAPYRTITRALAAADGVVDVTIRVAMGTYDAAAGESFPLRLPVGIRLRGHGSKLSIVAGPAEATLFAIAPGRGRIVLDGLALRGARRGLACEAPAGTEITLQLGDVLFEQLGIGVDLRGRGPAEGGLRRVHASGARFRGCALGIAASGEAPLELALDHCTFSQGDVGLALDGTTEAGQGVHHRISTRHCQFEEQATAGVQRTGDDGGNRTGRPYVFEDCLFRRNKVGIELQRPAGDTPLWIRRCSFLENELFGLQSTGQLGDPEAVSRIEDSVFRWNGVGLHVVNTRVRYEVARNRIVDNLGNGVFYAGFDAETGRARFANNLIAHNGASGIFLLADARPLGVDLVHDTIVHNAGSGIERKHRHGGESSFAIVGCIVAGNEPDLVRVLEGEVRGCLIQDGSVAGSSNLAGDPGFADAPGRDYRLRADSRCVDRGTADAASAGTDLDGHPRDGRPDLGAYERQ